MEPHKNPDKRAAALQATLELIAEQGFHATPMSQIAGRADIGVGTIYRYFSGKDDLINSLYVDIKKKMNRQVLKNYSEDRPVFDCFYEMIRCTIAYYIENQLELSFLEQYENSPLITAAAREEGAIHALPLNKIFSRAGQENLFKDIPLPTLGALISGSAISLAKLYRFNPPDPGTFDTAIGAIWDMVAK